MATLVLRPAVALQPNTRSCGNQPAHVSLDTRVAHRHADPARPPRSPTPTSARPHGSSVAMSSPRSRPSPPGGLRPALTPGSGHRRSAPSGAHDGTINVPRYAEIADDLRRAHLTIVAPYQPGFGVARPSETVGMSWSPFCGEGKTDG